MAGDSSGTRGDTRVVPIPAAEEGVSPDDSGAFYAERVKRQAIRQAVVQRAQEVAATVTSVFPPPLKHA